MHTSSGVRKPENGGDIQATTKAVDCRSLKSSPPFLSLRIRFAAGVNTSLVARFARCGLHGVSVLLRIPSRPMGVILGSHAGLSRTRRLHRGTTQQRP
jgi:hypothetical protein